MEILEPRDPRLRQARMIDRLFASVEAGLARRLAVREQADATHIPAQIVNPHFADHAVSLDLLEAASGLGERRARRYDEPMAAAIPFDAFNLDKEAS